MISTNVIIDRSSRNKLPKRVAEADNDNRGIATSGVKSSAIKIKIAIICNLLIILIEAF